MKSDNNIIFEPAPAHIPSTTEITGFLQFHKAWEAAVIPFHHTRSEHLGEIICGCEAVNRRSPFSEQTLACAPSAPPAAIAAAASVVVHIRQGHDRIQDRERI